MTSVGVARHDRACPELGQIVYQLYLKNDLNYEVVFFACSLGSIEVIVLFSHFN